MRERLKTCIGLERTNLMSLWQLGQMGINIKAKGCMNNRDIP